MDSLGVLDEVLADYQSFVEGFLNIQDEQVRAKVDAEVEGGLLVSAGVGKIYAQSMNVCGDFEWNFNVGLVLCPGDLAFENQVGRRCLGVQRGDREECIE